MRCVDVGLFNDQIANILVTVGSRICVLTTRNEMSSNTAQWREVYGAYRNLDAVHLMLHGSERAIDILSLVRTKLVSLKLNRLLKLISTGDRFFYLLTTSSVFKEVELHIWLLLPKALMRKLLKSFESVTPLTCRRKRPYVVPNKLMIDVIASNLEISDHLFRRRTHN